MPKAPGLGGYDALFTYPRQMQEQLTTEYNLKYSAEERRRPTKPDITFTVPAGYDEHVDHFANFFDGIRAGKLVVEDAAFGLRAAAPALACNDSYFQQKIISWDAEKMKIV